MRRRRRPNSRHGTSSPRFSSWERKEERNAKVVKSAWKKEHLRSLGYDYDDDYGNPQSARRRPQTLRRMISTTENLNREPPRTIMMTITQVLRNKEKQEAWRTFSRYTSYFWHCFAALASSIDRYKGRNSVVPPVPDSPSVPPVTIVVGQCTEIQQGVPVHGIHHSRNSSKTYLLRSCSASPGWISAMLA